MESAKTKNIDQYKEIHAKNPGFGKSSHLKLIEVFKILKFLNLGKSNAQISILDFGCGKSNLSELLESKCQNLEGEYQFFLYDPAVPEISTIPLDSADFLINTDVLEHIYEEDINKVLKDIFSVSEICYFNISTRLASTILPNGENAHCTVRKASWWLEKIKEFCPNAELLTSAMDEATIVTFETSKLLKFYFNIKHFKLIRKRAFWVYIATWLGLKDFLKTLLGRS